MNSFVSYIFTTGLMIVLLASCKKETSTPQYTDYYYEGIRYYFESSLKEHGLEEIYDTTELTIHLQLKEDSISFYHYPSANPDSVVFIHTFELKDEIGSLEKLIYIDESRAMRYNPFHTLQEDSIWFSQSGTMGSHQLRVAVKASLSSFH